MLGTLTKALNDRRRTAESDSETAYRGLIESAADGLDDADIQRVESVLQAVNKSPEQFESDVRHHGEGLRLSATVAGETEVCKQLKVLEQRKKTIQDTFTLAARKRDAACRSIEPRIASAAKELAAIASAKRRLSVEFPETSAGERLRLEARRTELEGTIKNLSASKVNIEAAIAEDRSQLAALEHRAKRRPKLIRHPMSLLEDRIDDPTGKQKLECESRIQTNEKRKAAVDDQLTGVRNELDEVSTLLKKDKR